MLKKKQLPKKNVTDTSKAIRRLKIGDRIILMLILRKLNFGNIFQCVTICPECKESVSVDFDVDEILKNVESRDAKIILKMNKETCTDINAGRYSLKIRPVNGIDQELLLIKENETSGHKGIGKKDNFDIHRSEKLIRSCIISCRPPLPRKISQKLLLSLSSKLEQLDPQAEIDLKLSCPNCQHSFKTHFDPEEFFLNEIDSIHSQLEHETHWIAFNYHWNEDTILSLPIRKRKNYIELINKTLAGEPL